MKSIITAMLVTILLLWGAAMAIYYSITLLTGPSMPLEMVMGLVLGLVFAPLLSLINDWFRR